MPDVNLSVLKENGITPDEYCTLWCISYSKPVEWLDIETKEGLVEYEKLLTTLEQKLWIKRIDNELILRHKANELLVDAVADIDFEKFWNEYHSIITEWKKTDKAACEKHWKKLLKKEKVKALANIQPYYDSAIEIRGRKVVKKARTYLADKNFNDEFETKADLQKHKRSASKMI